MAAKSEMQQLSSFFDDLVRCETRLYNALGERLRAKHDLAASQFEFLRYFRDHPGARVADTAANFAAGIGAISKGIDRLEARGFVNRDPNPADGRSSLVSLSTIGAELIDLAEVTYFEVLDELVSPALSRDEIAKAARAVAALRASLEQSRAGLPVG